MILLVDANIVLDFLLKREPFYDDSRKVMELCSHDDIQGCIALHTITTLWYILRKVPDDQRRAALRSICDLLEVVGTSHDKVVAALENADFKDFEDCIQTKCARSAHADYIVTRNPDDFKLSEVTVLTPQELIGKVLSKAE